MGFCTKIRVEDGLCQEIFRMGLFVFHYTFKKDGPGDIFKNSCHFSPLFPIKQDLIWLMLFLKRFQICSLPNTCAMSVLFPSCRGPHRYLNEAWWLPHSIGKVLNIRSL